MSVNRTSLGKRISFYRSKSNLTQEVLAAKVNCSREYIVQIENGTKVPSLSVLVKIANTLSVSADELLLDCLEHSSSANSEFHRLLLDCNETEQTVIIRITGRFCRLSLWEIYRWISSFWFSMLLLLSFPSLPKSPSALEMR